MGSVVCVLLEDWQTVSSYSHSVGVRKVFPDPNGTQLVLIDDKSGGFLHSPGNVSTHQYLIDPCMRAAKPKCTCIHSSSRSSYTHTHTHTDELP